jgi:hypothetical protein
VSPVFLTLDEVIEIHRDMIERYGGSLGVRDTGLLESAVAGQPLCFWSEIGYLFPTFPFIAHSRGWTAEDMENNMKYVQQSEELKAGARDLARRAVEYAQVVLAHHEAKRKLMTRGGRKGYDASERAKEEVPV